METTSTIFPCSLETARSVAHVLFALEYVGELEENSHDLSAFSGRDLTQLIEQVEDGRILPILGHLVGLIEGGWGVSLTVVFYHMGLSTEGERYLALLDLCPGCEGHGVSIADDYRAELMKAEDVLKRPLAQHPFFHDYVRFQALDSEVYDERYPAATPRLLAGVA